MTLSDDELEAIETDAREMADETRAKGGFNYLASTTLDLVAALRQERQLRADLTAALERINGRRNAYDATDEPLKLFTELECMRTWARAGLASFSVSKETQEQ